MSIFAGVAKPEWHDMSNYVADFTREYKGKQPYDNMKQILGAGTVEARNPFGIGRSKAPDPKTQHCVCFNEVPPHMLRRVAKARSDFGVGFSKDFVIHRTGNPILYAYKDSPLLFAFQASIEADKADAEAEIWKITPFVDAPGQYGYSEYFYEWEREWREVGEFGFPVEHVEFLIIPESLHQAAREFFDTAKQENLGPCYDCPFIDPYWPLKKVQSGSTDDIRAATSYAGSADEAHCHLLRRQVTMYTKIACALWRARSRYRDRLIDYFDRR